VFAAKVTPESLARFTVGLESFAQEAKWSMEYTSIYAAAWLCRDTMWYTPPFVNGSFQGTTKAAETAGEGALTRDVKRIFKPMHSDKEATAGQILINRLGRAAKMGDMSGYFDIQEAAKGFAFRSPVVQKFVNDPDPVRGYYKARNWFSNYDGLLEVGGKFVARGYDEMRVIHDKAKVTRGGRMRVARPANVLGYHVVKSDNVIERYLAERFKMIGKLKAGWWAVMQSLPKPKKKGRSGTVGGIRDISAYIKRHGFRPDGYQSTNFSPTNYKVVIGNRIGDTDAVATRVNAPGMALNNVDKRLEDELKQVIGQDVRQFNKG